jgi:hypothetical protein
VPLLIDDGHLISLMPHRQGQFVTAVREFLPPSQPPATD